MNGNVCAAGRKQLCADLCCRGESSGSIKCLPASVRQPLGFRTMYSSMHGEQIELRQAYTGALSAAAARPSTATCVPSTVTVTEPAQAQVAHTCSYSVDNNADAMLAKALGTVYGTLLP